MKSSKLTTATLVALLGLLLVACEGGLRSVSNSELEAKSDECTARAPTNPGKVTACENIRKECERRRSEGIFAC